MGNTYCKVGWYSSPPQTVDIQVMGSLDSNYTLNDYLGECLPASDPFIESLTNTNECIDLSFKLQNCLNGIDDDCCLPVEDFMQNACLCNSAVEYLTVSQSPNGQDEWNAFQTALVPICENYLGRTFPVKQCSNYVKYRRGCDIDDMELEKRRLQSVLGFAEPFKTAGEDSTPFDLEKLQFDLHLWTTDDITANVPFGVGRYTGVEDASEYVGIFFASNNKGFWTSGEIDNQGEAKIEFSSNSHQLLVKATTSGGFADNNVLYENKTLTQIYHFDECSTKIRQFDIVPDEDFAFFAAAWYIMGLTMKEWGIENICHYHDEYCGDYPQYDDFNDCVSYLNSIPTYSPACREEQGLLNGHSTTCRLKHTFMIPSAPDKHCPHIGKDGNPLRGNINHKCEDVYECGNAPDPTWATLPIPENGFAISQEWIDAASTVNAVVDTRSEWRFPDLAPYNCEISYFHLFACNPAVGEEFYDVDHCCEELATMNDNLCLCDLSGLSPALTAQYTIAVDACPSFVPQC